MPKSCIVCRAVASQDVLLQYCDACQSAMYCSRTCQRKDWKKQHKQICKFINKGHGDLQVRDNWHIDHSKALKERFELCERKIGEGMKRFFKLFQESTFEGSRDAAQKMRKYAKRQIKQNQKFLLLHSLYLLVNSDSEMLSWPNSPLLVLLQVDPNILSREERDVPSQEGGAKETPLHILADMADPNDNSTHVNQLTLAKQLIEHGANVNAEENHQGRTPLHKACFSGVVTNLDFVEHLLEAGADPNARDHTGQPSLMYTIPNAPGAAKFLLNWPSTNVNITSRSGESFQSAVRSLIASLSEKSARPDNLDPFRQFPQQFMIQQWRDIEEMLVKRSR
jgi:hypothetical protein